LVRPKSAETVPVIHCPGANPTIASYNANVVIFYNATDSLTRFENIIILFYFEKLSSLLQRWRCSCKFKSRRIGSRLEPMLKLQKIFLPNSL
jgi:hypothetical protein